MSASANNHNGASNNNGAANNNGAGGNGDNNQGASTTNASGVTSKANFQSYETQCRLLAALVASLEEKGIKLDYKLTAQYLGGGKSESAVEHHFRGVRLRAQVARGVGADPYRIPDAEFLEMGNGASGQRKAKEIIHKYFKASTPGGVEFKFREVRKTAQEMRAGAAAAGTTTTTTPSGTASAPATPRKRAAPASTPRKRAPASSTAGARKRAKQTMMAEDENDDDSEYKEKKARARPASRGGRRGSSAATATITPATTVRPSPTPSAATSSYQLFAPGWAPDSPAPVSRQLSLSETMDDLKRETEGGRDLSFFTQEQQVQRERDFHAGLQHQQQNAMQQFEYNPEQERLQLQHYYNHHHRQQSPYLPQPQPYAPSTGFPSQSQSQSPAHAPPRFTEEEGDFSSHADQHQQHYQRSFTEQLYENDEAEEDGEI